MTVNEKTIKRAQKGDEDAFQELFDAYASMVYSVGLRYMKDEDAAKDLMQEVFIKLFKKLKDFKFDGSFEGWLRKMTVFMAIDELRKKKEIFERFDAGSSVGFVAESSLVNALEALEAQDLLTLIKTLPRVYEIVFNLYAIEGYKHTEIAEMLHISVGTSKSNLHDARRILKEKIKVIG